MVEEHLDEAAFPQAEALAGKSVLITGAGGFIGSALALVASRAGVRSLALLESSEQNLFAIERRVRGAGCGCPVEAALASKYRFRAPVDVVFHAAAFKHVALLERNPFAALQNNALGTYELARDAARAGVSSFILISTDKAVEPRSVMGVSKALAELFTLSLGNGARVARLCNVIGSTGSVVPLFREQIAAGGPLTVTHPDARRFFVSLRQTVECVMSALGSRELVVTPACGEAVRIVDLARAMMTFAGVELPITFTGLQAGEKLCEKLVADAPGAWKLCEVERLAERLSECIEAQDLRGVLDVIRAAVPSYVPSELLR